MSTLALHLPEKHGIPRWVFAALTILLAHIAIVATIALWYGRRPVEPAIMPAIAVTLEPVEASSPEIPDQDIAVGPPMQQAEQAPREPPKEEKPVEKVEQPPSPPQQAEITLPRVEPKEIEKPVVQPPAPETLAPPKSEHVGQFTAASAKAYNDLVFGHLQRFKRYPPAARGAFGKVLLWFELNRAGEVIGSRIEKSSGNAVLDEEALNLLRRASPFPRFPAAKPGNQDSYTAPVNFAH